MWFCYLLGLTLGTLLSYRMGKAKAGDVVSVGLGFVVAILAPFFIATALHIDW